MGDGLSDIPNHRIVIFHDSCCFSRQMSYLYNIFAIRLNELIKKGEISKFSRDSEISDGTLRGYLKGSTSLNVENLLKIAIAGKVSVAWLVGEEEKQKRTPVLPYLPNKSMQEMAQWISEQNDGINYWEVAKAKFAQDFHDFKEWLKKHHSENSASGSKKISVNE